MAVDAEKIIKGVLGMGLRGDPDHGLLRGFGVILAINIADYLVGRELEYLHKYPDALEMMEASLVDAAQWCANATFGGMMKSAEWDGLCAPMISSVRDQLDALHAVQNSLGWGRISSHSFDPETRTYQMVVKHSYYVDNYVRKYGRSDRPRCYMWTGVAAGNMDLLLGGKVHEFEATEVQCEAMGHEACVFQTKAVPKLFDLL